MKSYLKEISVGEVIDGSVRLYFRNFATIFLIYLLPLFVVELIIIAIWPHHDPSVEFFSTGNALVEGLRFVAAIPASAAITVAVSEITLGHKPRVARAYGRVLDVIGQFLWTYLLGTLILAIGFVLLVLPGIIALVLLMFSTVVVMLERRSGFDALRRSVALGKGYYWRNFGALVLSMVLILTGQLILGLPVAMFAAAVEVEPGIATRLLLAAISNVFTPILMILATLLYYDLRIRKENYDTATLAQDLVG
jgi:Uncharacterised protein family (UPF0259)